MGLQLSRPMRIVGPIQFWRGCMFYRSAPKSGLGPRKNADLVHAKVGTWSTQKCRLGSLRNTSLFLGLYSRSNSGTHPRFQGSTRDRDEIELRNTSSFLGLYSRLRSRSRSRSRSNSGTHPFFQGSTQDRDRDRDRTPEHIVVFKRPCKILAMQDIGHIWWPLDSIFQTSENT